MKKIYIIIWSELLNVNILPQSTYGAGFSIMYEWVRINISSMPKSTVTSGKYFFLDKVKSYLKTVFYMSV